MEWLSNDFAEVFDLVRFNRILDLKGNCCKKCRTDYKYSSALAISKLSDLVFGNNAISPQSLHQATFNYVLVKFINKTFKRNIGLTLGNTKANCVLK